MHSQLRWNYVCTATSDSITIGNMLYLVIGKSVERPHYLSKQWILYQVCSGCCSAYVSHSTQCFWLLFQLNPQLFLKGKKNIIIQNNKIFTSLNHKPLDWIDMLSQHINIYFNHQLHSDTSSWLVNFFGVQDCIAVLTLLFINCQC